MTAETQEYQPQEALRVLRGAGLFKGLSDTALQSVVEVAQSVNVPAGESLFEEGDAGDAFYDMAYGVMALVKTVPGGGEEKRAVEDSQLLRVPREGFESLLGGDGLSLRMLKALSTALRALDVRFVHLEHKFLSASQASGS
jgi:CRP-like cAMP-binding protein